MALSSTQYSIIVFMLLGACGTQYADAIAEGSAAAPDPCSTWLTESECRADTLHGCSFQPNDVGCHVADPTCAPGICRGGDPFVRRSGATLWLHAAPFTFVGAVSWGVAWDPDGCRMSSLPDQEQALERTFDDLADMRAAVLKIWAFQSFAGNSGVDYTSFDRVVAAARRAGVRLIFVLENYWQDCTAGERNDAWFGGGYQAPYAGYALSLPDYAAGLVEHFRDEPTVLAWEVMHEARGDDFSVLDGFAATMSSLIGERDPNHLIALGLDNGDSPATSRFGEPSNYFRLHEHPEIDLVDVHDFELESQPLPARASEAGAIATLLEKPAFAGATAVALGDTSSESLRARAAAVEDKLLAAFNAGFVGFLVYDYYPHWDIPGYPFDARPEEPLAGTNGVIARHASGNQ